MKMTPAQMKTIRTLIANQQLYWEHGFTPEDLRSPCTLREMAEVAELAQAVREDMKTNHVDEQEPDYCVDCGCILTSHESETLCHACEERED